MRKLILFLVRYNTAFLFVILQAAALLFIYRTQSYQRSTMFALNAEWSGKVLSAYNNIDDYLNLAKINKKLAAENALLKSVNKAAYFSLTVDRDTVVDTLYSQQYTYINARVINSSFRKRNNYITLNKGKLHGVKPDMAVASTEGVIGVVKDVSPHFCSVIPIIHGQSMISGSFKKTNHFGTITWNGHNYREAQMQDVPREAKIQVGDSIVSNTVSVAFPPNLLIGTVAGFELNPEDQTYDIHINLANDFSSLDFVYIIDNLLKDERVKLESEQGQ